MEGEVGIRKGLDKVHIVHKMHMGGGAKGCIKIGRWMM